MASTSKVSKKTFQQIAGIASQLADILNESLVLEYPPYTLKHFPNPERYRHFTDPLNYGDAEGLVLQLATCPLVKIKYTHLREFPKDIISQRMHDWAYKMLKSLREDLKRDLRNRSHERSFHVEFFVHTFVNVILQTTYAANGTITVEEIFLEALMLASRYRLFTTAYIYQAIFVYVKNHPDALEVCRSLIYLISSLTSGIHYDAFKELSCFFYEEFLAVYNPTLRKNLGVWQTPESVTTYINRMVHKFCKEKFPDQDVVLFDFAAGTGTFVKKAIEFLYSEFKIHDTLETHRDYYINNIFAIEYNPVAHFISIYVLENTLRRLGIELKQGEYLHLINHDTLKIDDAYEFFCCPDTSVLTYEQYLDYLGVKIQKKPKKTATTEEEEEDEGTALELMDTPLPEEKKAPQTLFVIPDSPPVVKQSKPAAPKPKKKSPPPQDTPSLF